MHGCRCGRRRAGVATPRSFARACGEPSPSIASTGSPHERDASSAGLPMVALVKQNVGCRRRSARTAAGAGAARARRGCRRRRGTCAARRRPRTAVVGGTSPTDRGDGRMPMCSISGLVSRRWRGRGSTRARRWGCRRRRSRRRRRAPATRGRCAAGPARAPWSGTRAARCRGAVGDAPRRSAAGSRATCPTRCRWRSRRSCPARSASTAAAWCDHNPSMPRPRRRESIRGESAVPSFA